MNIHALRSLFSEQVTYWLSTIGLLESTIFFIFDFRVSITLSTYSSSIITWSGFTPTWRRGTQSPLLNYTYIVGKFQIWLIANHTIIPTAYSNTYSLASMSYNRNLSKCYLSPSHLAKYRYTQSMILTWGALANSKVTVGGMTRWTWWEWSELHSYAFLDFSSLLSCAGASSLPCFKYIVGFSWRRLKCVLFQSSPFSK